ncbi:MAG: hypothetical protein KDC54_11330 [Lewinella sp.]|nr:hypothetical protein [Lewinella sp.]
MIRFTALLPILMICLACQSDEDSFPDIAEIVQQLEQPIPDSTGTQNFRFYKRWHSRMRATSREPHNTGPRVAASLERSFLLGGIGFRTTQDRLGLFALTYEQDRLLEIQQLYDHPLQAHGTPAAGRFTLALSRCAPEAAKRSENCCDYLLETRMVTNGQIHYQQDTIPLHDFYRYPKQILAGDALPDDHDILLYTLFNEVGHATSAPSKEVISSGPITYLVLRFFSTTEENERWQGFRDHDYPNRLLGAEDHPAGLVLTMAEWQAYFSAQD